MPDFENCDGCGRKLVKEVTPSGGVQYVCVRYNPISLKHGYLYRELTNERGRLMPM